MRTYDSAVEAALGQLDLDDKSRLLAGQDMWSLPALPKIGLDSLVMSDGPVGVRGVRWTATDPSIALPSPTALAASWDVDLARRAGHLLAQEARRKGVHVVLAPTVNLHRSPLGGRHFECYSEDPHLTGRIGTGYVRGVQEGGVGTTVKHFVANDAETERFTVDNAVGTRALRELYLAPFETVVRQARPWGIMAAYNSVNGSTMTEHGHLLNEVLRGEWGFDGFVVSDWFAARDTVRAITGGLDVAMPGPRTVYGETLAQAVRAGEVDESVVDGAVRNVLRLAARVGVLTGVPAAVEPEDRPPHIEGRTLAREVARRSSVLVRNECGILPLTRSTTHRLVVVGAAAQDPRILGGGSAEVFPDHIVSPLEGLREALPCGTVTHAVGADPGGELVVADKGFDLRAVVRSADGRILAEEGLPNGSVQWHGDFPDGVDYQELHTVEVVGAFTPRETGRHRFGPKGLGGFRLVVAGTVLFDGIQRSESSGLFEAVFDAPVVRGHVELAAGERVDISLVHTVDKTAGPLPLDSVGFGLAHGEPQRDPDELIAEGVTAARKADTAVVVVATTERVESEGFDRSTLELPGRQDELVRQVAAANPRTVVVVNSGSPVEMPWRNDVAAILLSWFPGQEAGAALADVLLGDAEPAGRLPTSWPALLDEAPVTRVAPENGELAYEEGVFIGYRAWQLVDPTPAYCFGHGFGYTDWDYESVVYEAAGESDLGSVIVRVRNIGDLTGREVVQVYLAVPENDVVERPARCLAGFASVEAAPGEAVEVTIALPRRVVEIWNEQTDDWRSVPGVYSAEVGRSLDDLRLRTAVEV
ncbi:beta-glucosidase family protein [Parasphingorhabdus pacifica]